GAAHAGEAGRHAGTIHFGNRCRVRRSLNPNPEKRQCLNVNAPAAGLGGNSWSKSPLPCCTPALLPTSFAAISLPTFFPTCPRRLVFVATCLCWRLRRSSET